MDPMAKMMVNMGFPYENDVTKPDHVWVFSFPVKSPDSAITIDQTTAIDQLELWKTYSQYWAEHKVSCTIHIKENEWMDVGAWVYRNFDEISGISFLPYSGHAYKQAPFQSVSEKEYIEWLKKMPNDVDWERLKDYEADDSSVATHRELSCSAAQCDMVDLTNGGKS
jgi:ribonucleoside-diphosphate reductase alpha chain